MLYLLNIWIVCYDYKLNDYINPTHAFSVSVCYTKVFLLLLLGQTYGEKYKYASSLFRISA